MYTSNSQIDKNRQSHFNWISTQLKLEIESALLWGWQFKRDNVARKEWKLSAVLTREQNMHSILEHRYTCIWGLKGLNSWFLILDNHVKNKKYGNFVSISSLTGKCAAQQIKKNFCSSSLWTCLHDMVILRSQNKITDFFMISAWVWAFKECKIWILSRNTDIHVYGDLNVTNNIHFQSLEVVYRGSETQLQVTENFNCIAQWSNK